jgi:hypothetical protein
MNDPLHRWRVPACDPCWRCAWRCLRQRRCARRCATATTSSPSSTRSWSPPARWTAASSRRRPRRRSAPGETAARPTELRRQALDALIEERVIITHARDIGVRIDDADLDRAVQSVAQQNQLTLDQLRERCGRRASTSAASANLRDQLMVERIREREVYQRIRITDLEIDRLVDQQRAAAQADAELNIAQILVTCPKAPAPPSARPRAAAELRAGAGARRRGLRHRGARAVRRRQPRQGRRDRPAPRVAPARPVRRRRAAAGAGRGGAGPAASAAPAFTC